MLRIKLTIPGAAKNINLEQFTGNSLNIVGDSQFFINDDCTEADVWLIIEDLEAGTNSCHVPANRIAYLSAESAWPVGYFCETPNIDRFLDQFSHFFTCHEIYRDSKYAELPFLPWMINANHGPSIFENNQRDINYFRELNSIEKTKSISIFCSNQQWTEQHRMRFRFTQQLKDHFKDRLDWYGNGVQQIEKKWDGLAPYKYSIVLENTSRDLVISEKLYDSFLTLTYPIYWGSPRASDYFDENSFREIDVYDFKKSVSDIEEILETDPYEGSLPSLIENKNRVLNEMNFAKRLEAVARTVYLTGNGFSSEDISLFSKQEIFNLHKTPRKFNRQFFGKAIKRLGTIIEG